MSSWRRSLLPLAAIALALGAVQPAGAQTAHPDRILVRFKAGVTVDGRSPTLQRLGVRTRRSGTLGPVSVLERTDPSKPTAELIAKLEASGLVEYAEPDFRVRALDTRPSDAHYGNLWGLERIQAPLAWDDTQGSAGIVVAVVDTGVDTTHPDLAANLWRNPGETPNGHDDDGNGYVDDVHGVNCITGSGDPYDDEGHGTHVAGTIGAVGDNGEGVAGVNWSVRIMALKFLDARGDGYLSDAVECLDYATRMKVESGIDVRVTNNSWGGGGYSRALEDAIRASTDAGTLFVAAAGNDGHDGDASPSYPAGYDVPGVVSVGATNRSDDLAWFSDYGAASVDLAAPGVDILSTTPRGYEPDSGTSMAAPHVAGAAALLWSAYGGEDAAAIRQRLLDCADVVPRLLGRIAGGRRLSLACLGEGPPPVPDDADGAGAPVAGESLKLKQRVVGGAVALKLVVRDPRLTGALARGADPRSSFVVNPSTGESWGLGGSDDCTWKLAKGRFTLRCLFVGFSLDEAVQARLVVGIRTAGAGGPTFCAEFGGDVKLDAGVGWRSPGSPGVFAATRAPAAASCEF